MSPLRRSEVIGLKMMAQAAYQALLVACCGWDQEQLHEASSSEEVRKASSLFGVLLFSLDVANG